MTEKSNVGTLQCDHTADAKKEAEGKLCLRQLFNFKRSSPGVEEYQPKYTTAVSQLHAYFDPVTSFATAATMGKLKI